MSLTFLRNAQAQEMFGTSNGTIHITGIWNDSALVAVSNELVVLLNYETAEFVLRLDKSTLKTGVDSLDKKLKKLQEDFIIYDGKLGLEFIQTKRHPPMDFDVDGYLTCSSHTETLVGQGTLEHIFGGVYSCLLSMTFHVKLHESDLNIELEGLADEIHIEIIQAVLRKEDG